MKDYSDNRKPLLTAQQRRGILYFVPLLAIVIIIIAVARKPHTQESFLQLTDLTVDSAQMARGTGSRDYTRREIREKNPQPELFAFDPNTIAVVDLQKLGFTQKQAQGIANYRAAGKIFRTPEDFSDCWQVSDETFARLRPYIKIDREALPETGYKTGRGNEIAPMEDSARRETVPVQKIPVEINSADSALLVTVSGIGPITAQRIVAYREKLGGYADIRQLTEVEGMREANYERIVKEILIDSSAITKIPINFASPKSLGEHPYIDGKLLRKVLKHRQLKGGWIDIREMTEQDILTTQEATRLAPYLIFTTRDNN